MCWCCGSMKCIIRLSSATDQEDMCRECWDGIEFGFFETGYLTIGSIHEGINLVKL